MINRLATEPVCAEAAWGQPFDGESHDAAKGVVDAFLAQDRSLAGRVARDVVLVFASLGGVTLNRAAALESVGLTDAGLDGDPSADPIGRRAAIETISVARTIEARSNGSDGSPADVALYVELHEDRSDAGYDRALTIGAWGGTVIARMYTSGRLDSELPAFSSRWDSMGRMEAVGWYPNPINAGDTSSGEAEIERWWDGNDWTDRVRIRQGRRLEEHQLSVFTAPQN
ncbi:MAG: hypothetical protein BGO11_07520 [Solirubrobacterales bacterium 70-9]|nr:MAG: hypothetical protein BGO11_07520 [Solirubrobacterales bacterium 70-9]